jgi:hypothetical protein
MGVKDNYPYKLSDPRSISTVIIIIIINNNFYILSNMAFSHVTKIITI